MAYIVAGKECEFFEECPGCSMRFVCKAKDECHLHDPKNSAYFGPRSREFTSTGRRVSTSRANP